MLILPAILDPDQISAFRDALAGLPFVDGGVTAEGDARQAKQNTEAEGRNAAVRKLGQEIKAHLAKGRGSASYARPVAWAPIIFSRYGPGDQYGEHVDAPFMVADDGREMRADLSFTVFLSPPEDYEGGELILQTSWGPKEVKLAAGSAVIYPTSVIHSVAPVRAGQRRVAVGWIQSRIPDEALRVMLYEYEQTVASMPKGPQRAKLTQFFANLLKMWSD